MFANHNFSCLNWTRPFRAVTIILACLLAGCTDNEEDTSLNPLEAVGLTKWVSDLEVTAIAADKVTISWTAPAAGGEELYYQIRHSQDSLTADNWSQAVVCPYVPPVADSGVTQSYDITGLPAGKLSYIAVRVYNAGGKFGPIPDNVSAALPSLLAKPVSYDFSGTAIAASDIDSDGDVDLVISKQTYDDDALITLTNDGTGRFAENQVLRLVGVSTAVRTPDFNNDGYNDIAALSYTSILVLTNNGTGYFSVADSQYVGQNVRDMEVADFDGDGFTDIIAGSTVYGGKFGGGSALLAIYFNDGNGGFNERDTVNTLYDLTDLWVFDADDDGDIDIAANYSNSNAITLKYNDGTGRNWDNGQTVDMGNPLWRITSGDMNNDGKQDLIGTWDDKIMVAVKNDEDDYSLKISTPGSVGDLGLGDFDGDGFLDAVRSFKLALSLNDGEAGFAGAANYIAGADVWGRSLDVADFDRDGHADIALIASTEKLMIFLSSL